MVHTDLLAGFLAFLRHSYIHPNPIQTPTPSMYFFPLHEPPTLTMSPAAPESLLQPGLKSVSPALPPAQPHPSSPRSPCQDIWRAAGWGCPASFGTGRSLCFAVRLVSLPAWRAPHGSSVGGGWQWVHSAGGGRPACHHYCSPLLVRRFVRCGGPWKVEVLPTPIHSYKVGAAAPPLGKPKARMAVISRNRQLGDLLDKPTRVLSTYLVGRFQLQGSPQDGNGLTVFTLLSQHLWERGTQSLYPPRTSLSSALQ